MRKLLKSIDRDDLLAVLALALIAVGVGMIYVPAALIVVGAVLMALWWRL